MHWIQTIRENLELSQKELAHYLRLSEHTIRSVESDRRQLPVNSLRVAMILYNAIKDCPARSLAGDPLLKADHRIRRVKRFHHQYSRRHDRCTRKFEKMQKVYMSACLRLGVYQLLARALTPAQSKDDLARLHWTQQKINEAMQLVQDNHVTAQHLLIAEIAGLKSMILALEGYLQVGMVNKKSRGSE